MQTTFEGCEMIPYVIEQNESLASIAREFSVSEEEIMAFNHLKTETIQTGMDLVLLWNFTPTGSVHPATFTTTYTPRPGG